MYKCISYALETTNYMNFYPAFRNTNIQIKLFIFPPFSFFFKAIRELMAQILHSIQIHLILFKLFLNDNLKLCST